MPAPIVVDALLLKTRIFFGSNLDRIAHKKKKQYRKVLLFVLLILPKLPANNILIDRGHFFH